MRLLFNFLTIQMNNLTCLLPLLQDCGTLSAGPAAARAAVESEGRGQAEGSQSPSNASQEESTNTTPTSAGRRYGPDS